MDETVNLTTKRDMNIYVMHTAILIKVAILG